MNITVAVTGMNARADNPGPGLAIARCLKESNTPIRVIGLGYEALDPALYHRGFIDRGYLLPYPSHGEDALLARLLDLHAREHFDVIIPCLDAEMTSFVRLEPALASMGIRTFIPNSRQLTLRSKDRLPELAEEIGLASPKTKAVYQSSFFITVKAKTGVIH
jgi:carbamoyl-phosphate synthase large subunit